MPFFSSSNELIEIMTELWESIKADPAMSKKLMESKLIAQFRYRDPEGVLTVDCSRPEGLKIFAGAIEIKVDIEMSMKADVAHEFWLGKVNVPMAIMMGKISSKGPTPKALALLPAIKPAHIIYPKVLQKIGKNY